MFRITQKQKAGFSPSLHDSYVERVTGRIVKDFPEEFSAVSRVELKSRVRVAFDRFCAAGFSRKEHLHRLIVLEMLYGPEFERALPDDVQSTSFHSTAPEGERFWAVYKAADHLKRDEPPDADDPFVDLKFVREQEA